MLRFDSDYMEGAAPEIIERLAATNLLQTSGYGTDELCASARERIRAACAAPDAAVHFLVGGTQTNAAALDQLLRPWEGVLAVASGHINVHEAGAIEACGHKVIALPDAGGAGKLTAEQVRAYCTTFWADQTYEHMTAPGAAYISHPTELGTLYTFDELEELSATCHEFGLRLYVDGARLGYGLATGDVTLPDLARLTDAFYIGGTKVGALFGEAVVFPHPANPAGGAGAAGLPLDAHFFSLMKKHGALLAKGRLLGLQFDELFADGLYERLGHHAVEQAQRLVAGLRAKGYELAYPSPTNQQFPVLGDDVVEQLREHATFEAWEPRDNGTTVVRFVTSWATKPQAIDDLLALL